MELALHVADVTPFGPPPTPSWTSPGRTPRRGISTLWVGTEDPDPAGWVARVGDELLPRLREVQPVRRPAAE